MLQLKMNVNEHTRVGLLVHTGIRIAPDYKCTCSVMPANFEIVSPRPANLCLEVYVTCALGSQTQRSHLQM